MSRTEIDALRRQLMLSMILVVAGFCLLAYGLLTAVGWPIGVLILLGLAAQARVLLRTRKAAAQPG